METFIYKKKFCPENFIFATSLKYTIECMLVLEGIGPRLDEGFHSSPAK